MKVQHSFVMEEERGEASTELKPWCPLGELHLDKEVNTVENDKGLQESEMNEKEGESPGESVSPRACHNSYHKMLVKWKMVYLMHNGPYFPLKS